MDLARGLWRYRQFVISSIRNELVSRFARSKLGGLWIILNPLAQVAIYALILSNVLAAKMPGVQDKYAYAVYLMAGTLAWSLFSEIVTRCLTLFIEQGNLMKKMSFPRITLPTIVVGSALLNNFFLFLAMTGIFLVLGHPLHCMMLWLIPLTLIVVIFALGFGLILGVMNVFIRDIGQMMTIILQVWFWFTPVVYPENVIPEQFRHWFIFNPMATFVNAYHRVLVYNESPASSNLLILLGVALVLVGISLFMFRRASAEMVDVL